MKNMQCERQGKTFLVGVMIMFILLLVGLTSASLGTFKQGDCVQIVTNLNSTSINITDITTPTPNPIIDVANVQMTANGNLFNYTYCNTSALGTYTYGYCDNGGNCYSNDFSITPSGAELSTGQSMIYIVSVISMIIVCFIFYMISNVFVDKKDKDSNGKDILKSGNPALRFGFLGMSMITALTMVIYIALSLDQIIPQFSNIVSGYSYFQYIFLMIFIIIFIFVLISLIIQAIDSMRIKRGLKEDD
jgi:hypothetical protein